MRKQPRRAGARMGESAICGRDGAGQRVAETTVESSVLGEVSVRRIEYIPATAMDNPHVTRDYIIELEQKPKALREALLLGKWDAFDGQAFPEFADDPAHYEDGLYTHVIKPFKIPWHWTRVVSFDHGYTRPFSFGVWAVDEEGRVYRYKELYGCVPGEANVGVTCPPGEIARAAGRSDGAGVSGGHTRQRYCRPRDLGQKPGAERGRADSEGIQRRDLHEGGQHAAAGQDAAARAPEI